MSDEPLDLFSQPMRFDGLTYEKDQDQSRLAAQMQRVARLVLDGHWRTLAEIAARTNDPESSVSARLRDLRKERFGSWDVQRRRRSKGCFEYRVTEKEKAVA